MGYQASWERAAGNGSKAIIKAPSESKAAAKLTLSV